MCTFSFETFGWHVPAAQGVLDGNRQGMAKVQLAIHGRRRKRNDIDAIFGGLAAAELRHEEPLRLPPVIPPCFDSDGVIRPEQRLGEV
jgi:hypothetical protein